ncbi:MAG: hypothetical protein KJ578_07890 [Bacteroidetes bacterium]|nr:hypothetical protein [Bacteroidota bacterium]MBU1580547.1 hypothetical protein [Bacteroidota bacterium]MBU2557683.1 hypothetical protein [Bacteroidota bacterium]
MKPIATLGLLWVFVFSMLSTQAQSVTEKLKSLGIDSIVPLTISTNQFESAFVISFLQPVDHQNPDGEKFYQRLILRHRSFDKPVVFVTEGYDASYGLNPAFSEELSSKLDANLLIAEHRFFGESMPEQKNWEALNLKNATADLHAVNQLLKEVYTAAWISTGISKGGQTSLYYRYFYPDDVAVTVPYVAPLNFSVADKRVQHFLDTVGDTHCRKKLHDLQYKLLNNSAIFLQYFKDSTTKRQLSFERVGGIEKAFELNVLELGFAYWQWYPYPCNEIPDTTSTDAVLFNAWIAAAGYDFFADQSLESMQAFFYQALTEMGFYTYDTKPFKQLLTHIRKPNFEHALPSGVSVKYKNKTNRKLNKWLKKNGNNIVYIYGGFDAWSSTAVQPTPKSNAIKIVKNQGSHATRLRHFTPEEQQQVIEFIQNKI